MKRLLLLTCAAVSVSVVGVATAKTTEWVGVPMSDGSADWSQTSNWTEGTPEGMDTAVLKAVEDSVQHPVLRLAPPISFTGIITVGTNTIKEISDSGRKLVPRAQLTVPDGAAWTVAGKAILIATDGIAARITSDFTGAIEVRKGITFVVPSNLSTEVAFIGDGEIVLDTSARLSQTHGFSGTVKFADEILSSSEVTEVMQRSVSLGDGQTLDISEHTLAMAGVTAMKGLDDDDAWSFNATTWTEGPFEPKFATEFPTYDDDGGLRLVDDPAQHRVAVYKERSFTIADSFGVRFTWIPALPANSRFVEAGWSQYRSGHFSILLQSSGATVTPSCNATTLYSGSYGFCLDCCDEAYGAPGVFCIAEWYEHKYLANPSAMGLNIAQPMEVSVIFDKGVMTVTYIQDERSFSLRRDLTKFLTQTSRRLWLTLDASSDSIGSNDRVKWMTQTVRNFRGWYRNQSEGAWSLVSNDSKFNPINTENWTIEHRDMRDKSNVITNNPANVLSNGDYLLQENAQNQFSVLHSYAKFTPDRRYRVSFDLDFGATLYQNAGAIAFGFVEWPPGNFMEKISESDNVAFNYGWERCWLATWQYYSANAYVKLWQARKTGPGDSRADSFQSPNGSVPTAANSMVRVDLTYDPAGTLDIALWRTNKNSQVSVFRSLSQTVDAAKAAEFRGMMDNMQFLFKGVGASGQALTLRNFHVYEMVENGNPALCSSVAVEENASSVLAVGAPVVTDNTPAATLDALTLGPGASITVSNTTSAATLNVKRIEVDGAAALTALTGAAVVGISEFSFVGDDAVLSADGSVSCADALMVVVPRRWVRAQVARTLSSGFALPPASAVNVVSDDGIDFTERAKVKVEGGRLSVDFRMGFIMVFQ